MVWSQSLNPHFVGRRVVLGNFTCYSLNFINDLYIVISVDLVFPVFTYQWIVTELEFDLGIGIIDPFICNFSSRIAVKSLPYFQCTYTNGW